ncbi:MAG: peptidylprolyl isomerase [Acidobacteria bacterium]|nr:peptidylprolyl isomerase [Acidobacteriota bacterium]
MKSHKKLVLFIVIAVSLVAAQSCQLLFKSDFADLKANDLTAMVATYPDMYIRQFAQSEPARKQIINQQKQAFALAQAAEAEGLHKTEKFKRQMEISVDQLLAAEYTKRNPEVTVGKEEWEAYYASHKAQFDADIKFITESRKQQIPDEMKEQQRGMWSEMKVRAEKARQAGLDKDPSFVTLTKFRKADALANLYAQLLEERNKLTDAERKKYLAEHPEADLEKLREKAQSILDRLNRGEDFIKLADEFTEDGGRGRGGELPWFAADGTISGGGGKMDEEFTRATFALKNGETSKELVKTSFGFHIIRVDDRRMATPPAAPSPSPAAPNATPAPKPTPAEEVLARHIIITTQEAESFESRLIQEKIKRGMEDASLKYPVNAPADFVVNVAGLDRGRIPGLGGGQGGTMRGITPQENK